MIFFANVIHTRLLQVISRAVIPAKAGIQKKTGFRVKPGMTNKIKGTFDPLTLRILGPKARVSPPVRWPSAF
jgi:hypothetical protein